MERASQRTADADEGATRPELKAGQPAPSARAVAAALGGMAAAWLAAGSTGLLAHPLRHGLTWVALAVAILACWPARQQRTRREHVAVAAAVIVAMVMTVPAVPVYNVLAVALVLAMLAWANAGRDGRVLLVTALAAGVLGVYLLACTSIPTVWLLADALSRALGGLAGWISGKPLWVGATFGGLDFLVLMAVLYVGWLASTPPPRPFRAVYAAAAILCGHLVYLMLLACSADLAAALPPPPPPPQLRDLYIPPPWSWTGAIRTWLPWNMPLLAGVIQLGIAAVMFRGAAWLPASGDQPRAETTRFQPKQARANREGGAKQAAGPTSPRKQAIAWGLVVLAVLVPLLVTLAPGQSDLAGKTIVACEEGLLNWEKPVHDRYGEASAGLYGMLPEFVESLGGQFKRSADLSQEDLAGADVLMLIHPAGTWPRDRLQRISNFVERGGSLLVLAETPLQEGDLASSYNEVLEYVLQPTGMQVGFDTAVSVTAKWQYSYRVAYVTGNWQHSCTAMAHPAVAGIGDARNRFGIGLGPSIRVRWPARPVLVGRWGWSDPGIDSALTGKYRFDAGERLGDVVLAAEQRSGRGTVVVLSDTSCFTNEGNVKSYVFTGRLMAYLAGRAINPQAAWRQAVGLLGCLALVGLLARPLEAAKIATVAIVLALSLGGSRAFSHLSTRVLPDGRKHPAYNNVAYIDASHLEAYSDDPWSSDGIAGLELTLMRNGYVPFLLPELTSERLDRAGMLISIAPARRFSAAERAAVQRFVQNGGIFISTVGAEHARPTKSLLEDFDLGVPRSPLPAAETGHEPTPMSAFIAAYHADGNANRFVHFYAGWPIECPEPSVLVRGPEDIPVASWQTVGKGKVVLIGDTAFAMNKNLEYVGGEPFYERYDNAYFWRWLITRLTDQEDWIPPELPSQEPSDAQTPPEAAETEPNAAGASKDLSMGKAPSRNNFALREGDSPIFASRKSGQSPSSSSNPKETP